MDVVTDPVPEDVVLSTDDPLRNLTDRAFQNLHPWETSDPLTSPETRKIISRIFICYVRQVIAFVGVPGNTICCVVFYKQGLSDRINLLLFWLGLADLLHLLTSLLSLVGCLSLHPLVQLSWGAISNAKVVYLNLWSAVVSGNLLLVISVDRCLFVLRPLTARTLVTTRAVMAAIALSFLLPLPFYLPAFLNSSVEWRLDPSTNGSVAYVSAASWFPMDTRTALMILRTLYLVGRPLSLVTIVTCSILTIVHLRKASSKRLEMASSGKKRTEEEAAGDHRITLLLLLLCAVYTALVLPEACSGFVQLLIPEYNLFRRYHNTYVILNQMLNFTASCLNSTLNFFGYLALSSKFRTTLRGLCCW